MLDHYTLLAPVYDLATARVLSPLRETVGRLVAAKGFVRVLDVGCGTGVQCVMLHALGCRTTGLDASPAMLARARRQSPAGVAYVRSDASGMPFADTAFDAAIISLALHENKPAVRTAILKEMRRVVRPGGGLLLVDYLRPETPTARLGSLAAHLPERIAGKAHYQGFISFLEAGGAQTALSEIDARVVQTIPFFFGAVGLVEARTA
jgi:demethylmenaquinone methyltransferase/2-methoxy-6-polyprenyl-1,4-benzoquinol methylase